MTSSVGRGEETHSSSDLGSPCCPFEHLLFRRRLQKNAEGQLGSSRERVQRLLTTNKISQS